MLVTPKLLNPDTADRLAIEVTLCREHLARLKRIPDLAGRLGAVYAERRLPEIADPDRMLYSGGFFSDGDRRIMDEVRKATPEQLASESFVFEDARVPEMLFRYRARNFPDSLGDEERARWEEFRFSYLTDPAEGASITLDAYQETIDSLLVDANPPRREILEQLLEYGDSLLAG
jgi:exodeoxyribonuclease-1